MWSSFVLWFIFKPFIYCTGPTVFCVCLSKCKTFFVIFYTICMQYLLFVIWNTNKRILEKKKKKKASDSLRHGGTKSNRRKQTGGEGVTAVVKQLAQRRAAIGASGLLPVNGVQWLVDEQAHSTQQVRPERSLKQHIHIEQESLHLEARKPKQAEADLVRSGDFSYTNQDMKSQCIQCV